MIIEESYSADDSYHSDNNIDEKKSIKSEIYLQNQKLNKRPALANLRNQLNVLE